MLGHRVSQAVASASDFRVEPGSQHAGRADAVLFVDPRLTGQLAAANCRGWFEKEHVHGKAQYYAYWFPKVFGFKLHKGLGKAAFWCWVLGFYLAFRRFTSWVSWE